MARQPDDFRGESRRPDVRLTFLLQSDVITAELELKKFAIGGQLFPPGHRPRLVLPMCTVQRTWTSDSSPTRHCRVAIL
jgi:hypothetical protein